MQSQCATFSHYKHCNTFNVLIGISPGGVITFVSNCGEVEYQTRPLQSQSPERFEDLHRIFIEHFLLTVDQIAVQQLHEGEVCQQ